MHRGETCTCPRAALIPCREKTHLNDLEGKKDPSGAEQLHRRSLDNHGELRASVPISLSSLCVCVCVESLSPSLSHTAELGRGCAAVRARGAAFPIPAGSERGGCAPCSWVDSGWKAGRRRTVRHLTGVCHPAGSTGGRGERARGGHRDRAWWRGASAPSRGCHGELARAWRRRRRRRRTRRRRRRRRRRSHPPPPPLRSSALIGSSQRLYNKRWPYTWDPRFKVHAESWNINLFYIYLSIHPSWSILTHPSEINPN